MIFKNYSDSAQILAKKILDNFPGATIVVCLNSSHSHLDQYRQKLSDFLNKQRQTPVDSNLLIISDPGLSQSADFEKPILALRKLYPRLKIIVAIPVIAESQKTHLQSLCDSLIYLHSETLFFSLNQFYEQANF
jgi:predicted phosphoribosyltransferase